MALFRRVRQNDGRRRGSVERIDVPVQRNRRGEITFFFDFGADALAFTADDDGQLALHIVLVIGHAVHIRRHNPEAPLLQVLDALAQIAGLDQGRVAHGPGGRLDGHGGHTGGPAFGEDDAVGSAEVGAADDGPEVVGVGDVVQDDHQGFFPLGGRQGQHVFHGAEGEGRHHGGDALVGLVTGHVFQLDPFHGLDHQAPRPGLVSQITEHVVLVVL